MMKFTFPVLTLSLGGAQRMIVEIANGLVQRGHDVTIVMPQSADISYPVRAAIQYTKGANLLEADYPVSDVIVSNFYTTVASAHLASQHGKGIHVRWSLCYEPPFLPDNHQSLPTYHLTPHVLVLSAWQQNLIQKMHGIRGCIVPIGVGQQFKNMDVRKQLNGPLQITSVVRKPEGGFSPHREQNYLIDELRHIRHKYPDVRINLICPPAEFYSSPSLKQLRDGGEFRFLTPKDDTEMCYHYNEADIFVSSSSYDAGSLPGLEAMRCGAALVTIYSGGNAAYCKHERNCLLSYRYQNRLSQDIERLLKDTALRKKLAAQGQRDSEKWTWERSVTAFEEAIRKIMRKA